MYKYVGFLAAVLFTTTVGCGAPIAPTTVSATGHADERPVHVHPPFASAVTAASWPRTVAADMVDDETQVLAEFLVTLWFHHAPGRQTGPVRVRPRFALTRLSDDRIEAQLQSEVAQTIAFSDTPEFAYVESHLLHEDTGWFTSSDDCRKKIAASCQRICRESRLDEGNTTTWLMDGVRRDTCRLAGDFMATGDRQRAQWCEVFEHHPSGCQRPESQVGHPVPDCAYRTAQISMQVTTHFACTMQEGWHCTAAVVLGSCRVASIDGGPAPTAACDATAAQLDQGWRASRQALAGARLGRALNHAYEP